jgi:hypothetical protein
MLTNLSMVFYSHYRRSYYESFDRRFRITIDSDLVFHAIDKFDQHILEPLEDEAVILELKYDRDIITEDVDAITQNIPFGVTKNSKYARGVMLTLNQ